MISIFPQSYEKLRAKQKNLFFFLPRRSNFVLFDGRVTPLVDSLDVFYRSKDGIKHDIGDSADYPHEKWRGIIPWLVFRKC